MITMSFKRFGNGIYISHTDVLRSLNRTMRRAEIGVKYSNGFNKHMSLKLTQPLPLGVASDDEWVTVDLKEEMPKEEFLQRIRENCPPFLFPKAVFYSEKNPSLAANVTASDYEISFPDAEKYKEKIEGFREGFRLNTLRNGEPVVIDAAGKIYDIRVSKGMIRCRFAFGSKNLRIDHFLQYLKEEIGIDIPLVNARRTAQLIEQYGAFVTATAFMEKFEK